MSQLQGVKDNRDQAVKWSGSSGCVWVEMQELLDGVLAPFETILTDAASPGDGGRVLDIGCGSGATTMSMARRVGPAGASVGVDISEPLIDLARKRAAAAGLDAATFVQGDAQTHAFERGRFDAVISRFGVMFFDDPVAAFANIRSAARPDGKLAFIAWRSPAENPFMAAAARATGHLLPNMTIASPDAPGQFGFADGSRVRRILDSSGWRGTEVRSIDVSASLSEPDLAAYTTKLGPVGVALQDPQVSETTRARVLVLLRDAFAPYVDNGMAHFMMACWLVTARA